LDPIIDSKNKGKAYRKLAKHNSISTEGEVLPAEVARPVRTVSTSNYSDIKESLNPRRRNSKTQESQMRQSFQVAIWEI
jgi:hypothetical protein